MQVLHASFNKVLLLEQKGHSAMNSINARSPHHIIWRGMAHDASSKKMSQFALIWFRKLLLVREHLLSLQISIVETKDYSLSSTGMGGKTAWFAQTLDLIKARELIMTGFLLINWDSFNFRNNTSLWIFSSKTTNTIEQYEVRRTGMLNFCPNITFIIGLERLKEHFH